MGEPEKKNEINIILSTKLLMATINDVPHIIFINDSNIENVLALSVPLKVVLENLKKNGITLDSVNTAPKIDSKMVV